MHLSFKLANDSFLTEVFALEMLVECIFFVIALYGLELSHFNELSACFKMRFSIVFVVFKLLMFNLGLLQYFFWIISK